MTEGRPDERASEDAELVAKMAGGDLGAPLAELVERYKGPLFGYGVKTLGDSWLAEELVHECFVRLWRNARKFDPSRASVRTYLFMMARSIAVDLYRRESPTRGIASSGALDQAGADDVAELIESLAVRDALNSLPPAHRDVIVLAHYEGLTQTEIAQRLGIPLGTVKTRMFHGLRALRGLIESRQDGG
jgi:RNA polymerase sigma-70 factor (ECF subfamily)